MTPQELNRDIKKLYKNYVKAEKEMSNGAFFKYVEDSIKHEWARLYDADTGLDYMNVESIKILLVLNRKLRIMPPKNFGLYINESKLK